MSELPWSVQELELPAELEELRQNAKRFSRESRYDKACEQNLMLADRSRAQGHVLGEVIGLRFAGVSEYRRECYSDSEQYLTKARDLARGKFHQQELHIANHLGATLRRLGRLDEALDTLRAGLELVRLPADLEAKARLLGNLGAFYEEIGYEGGAFDCYARYEELIELLVQSGDRDDGARLANARALSARAALRRGDLETALEKHDDEYQLADEAQDQLRIRNAIFHRAKIHLEMGLRAQADSAERAKLFDFAKTNLDRAYELFKTENHQSRMSDILHHFGRLYEAQNQWPEAHEAFKDAWLISSRVRHSYRQAETSLALARFCQRWALHGESLYWFRQAARIHCDQYTPLSKNKKIASFAHARTEELHDVAKKLADESRRVERERGELDDVDALIKPVIGTTLAGLAETAAFESVHDWQKRVRKESLERWRSLMSATIFDKLSPQSRDDLVMADMLYHGIVDELPRSALLIAIVVERELRERLFVPLYKIYPDSRDEWSARRLRPRSATAEYFNQPHADNVPIGNALRMVKEILDDAISHKPVVFARENTRSIRELLKNIARLDDTIEVLGAASKVVKLAFVRNEAAHGSEKTAKLDRMAVDALKRRLLLEAPRILESILAIDLRRTKK